MVRFRGWLWVMMLVGGWSLVVSVGCGAPSICEDDAFPSTLTINPNGSVCQRKCECNNQNYEGYCTSEGLCDSIPRGGCPREGARRGCLLRPVPADGVCGSGVQVCGENLKVEKWGDCKPLSKEEPENTKDLCGDGIDNDCDGILDKSDPDCSAFCNPGQIRPCYAGPEGTRNVGLCASGNEACNPDTGQWSGICSAQVQPSPEKCNGKDDDCNGKIDDLDQCVCAKEGAKEPCYGGPFGTAGKGKCKIGIRTCEVSGKVLRWGACEGQVLPSQEDCSNSLDDNCNGLVNEGCPCSTNDSPRVCGSALGSCKPGQQRCEGGAWSWRCDAEQGPTSEICDGRDNDCNGVEDDNLTRSCKTACGVGVERCVRGIWEACTAQNPKTEVCDNKDNDCDGRIDNGIRRLCKSNCGEGVEFCVEGRWLGCDAPKPQPEVCNGKDDDCNGSIDDKVQELGQVCDNDTTQKGECEKGKVSGCQQGKLVCKSNTTPRLETCDGLDNDCDGQVDEGALLCVQDVAGSGTAGLTEGSAMKAAFNKPRGLLWSDALGLLIADSQNHRIRRWDPVTGNVSTWAGSTQGFKEGTALTAQFNSPRDIQGPIRGGFYFVADSLNHRIRAISSSLQVSTFAGSGKKGLQNGPTLSGSEWNEPSFLVLEGTDLGVVDQGNRAVRSVDLNKDTIVTSFRGKFSSPTQYSGVSSYTFKQPRGVGATFRGFIQYVVDAGTHQVFFINITQQFVMVVGSGQSGFQDGPPGTAQFNGPTGVVVDPQGNAYVADTGNHSIRKINTRGYVTTVAGTGKPGYKNGLGSYAEFRAPENLTLDRKGDLYISDTGNHRIRKLILVR